jgi:phage tail sheath protein FI
VYIEEIPSGVRTITGVSTSVTAFVGAAKRGPIEKATRALSFADYERTFGGLDDSSEMSFAVRQFFLNGGSEAWIVRLTKTALAASKELVNDAGAPALKVSAVDAGKAGNFIELRVDYRTDNPDSTFNLSARYASSDGEIRTEQFTGLSMNSAHPRYVATLVNGVSTLIKVERLTSAAALAALPKGTSRSAALEDAGGVALDVSTLVDASHNELRLAVNGSEPVKVVLDPATDTAGADAGAKLARLCEAIRQKALAASGGQPAFAGADFCKPDGRVIAFESAVGGETSYVRVLPGERNDVTARLKLGLTNGGREVDGAAGIRPRQVPEPATLASGAFVANGLDAFPDATHTSFRLSLDGYGPDDVSVGVAPAVGADLAAKLKNIAARIETAVRALKPTNPAYREFTCTADTVASKLKLASGTRGAGSSIVVAAATANSIAAALNLLATATPGAVPLNCFLGDGEETQFDASSAYPVFIADRSKRKGIYALEAVDLFNLLALPGVADAGILMDATAYCEERRAFLIADAPDSADKNDDESLKPDKMEEAARGSGLPKSRNAAVYYPWIKIANPLKGGRLRKVAPSGTVAGLMARIDSARGVWKAPAGTEATLTGVQALAYTLTDPENGILNPRGVNCLRLFPVFGAVAWGARTLRGDDQMADEWKYIPVRRTALFLEESLYRGLKWVVFEPNDEPLWAQIRLNVGAFMQNLFRQGAFQGTTPREAYFVKCDKETTTQNDINLGIVNILVGFAPLKPAEFVILKLQQMAGQIAT